VSTEVKILGKTYTVRSEFDPSFTTKTADFVDSKMRELTGKAGLAPTEKIAVLTAMNLAGELLRVKKRESALREELKSKTKKLIKLINSHL
jgi:cell division protein ZapA (FtsZ GTPase activity inhibitor)